MLHESRPVHDVLHFGSPDKLVVRLRIFVVVGADDLEAEREIRVLRSEGCQRRDQHVVLLSRKKLSNDSKSNRIVRSRRHNGTLGWSNAVVDDGYFCAFKGGTARTV